MNAPVDRRLPAKRAKVALASLELATAMARVSIAKSIEPKPLYVRRDLLNASDLLAWAKRAGIPNLVAPSEMHVTICYSRAPVDWLAMGNAWPETVIVPKGGPRVLARFGKTDAKVAVLAFASSDLEWRHREMCDKGASFDFPSYRPHVTIGLNLPADFDLDAVEPYRGVLRFGPEVFEAIDDNFTVRMAKAGWSTQARVPSGPKGGQWTSSGYGGGVAGLGPKTPSSGPLAPPAGPKLTLPWLGQDDIATHRFKGDPQQAAFMKPMKESEMTGQPAWLGNDEGIVLKNPQTPTHPDHSDNPDDRATFVAGHDPGPGLNGIPFKPWDGPEGGDWTKVDGTGDFDEPDLPATKGKRLGAGVVIAEPDGRVWTLTPTNHFGGYFETLPKGGIEEGLNLRQTAIKEAWEESGLKVRLTGYIGDFERNTSVARYYRAERVGGDPTDYHWETAASHLVPMDDLDDALHHVNDKPILAALKGESDAIIKLALGFADLTELLGEIVEKGKAWSSQPRVPAGFPTGGRWMKGGYGQGGWGLMHAEQGVPLTLQKHGGTGPQSDALNAKIGMFEFAANQGYIHPAAQKLILKPKPTQTYSAAAWESANEAATYVHAMKGQGKPFGQAAKAPSAAKPKADAKPADSIKVVEAGSIFTTPSGTFKDPLKLSDMTKVGAKPGGTALGGLYKDADGNQWVVKSYKTPEMAFNEVASAKLYEMMNVAVPEMKLIDLGSDYHGGVGVASKLMNLKKFDENNPAHVKAAQEDFGAHALMANWDAVGQGFDNLMIDTATGKTVMVDPGGSMAYRAQGEPKGAKFKDNVAELDTMRDPLTNPQAAKVFGKMTQEQIVDSMQKALSGLADPNTGGLKQDAVNQMMAHWSGPKVGDNALFGIQVKMDNRVIDMGMKAKAMTADFASTAGLDIATTGTTKASLSHPDPQVQMLANIHQKADLEKIVSDMTNDFIANEANISGKSADYYVKHLAAAQKKAFAGDPEGLAATFVVPKSVNAKLSPNYGHYKKSFQNLKHIANAQAALKLQDAAKLGDGGLVTGASKVSPADVTVALKDTGMTAPGTNMLDAQGWPKDETPFKMNWGDAIPDGQTPVETSAPAIPKPAAKAVLSVPSAMPVMPKLSSPANPNLKLNALANAIAKIATSGEPDAAAKVQALSAMIKGSNSFSMKAKTYAANVVAALGGQATIDAIPQAAKKKAQEAAIGTASKVQAEAPLKSATKVVEGYTVLTETKKKPFDASKLTPPPDFFNWKGAGKPLYNTQPQYNQINNDIAKEMHSYAVKEDKPSVAKMDVSKSNQLTSYKDTLLYELDSIGTVETKATLMDASGKPADPAAVVKAIMDGQKVPKQKDFTVDKKVHSHVVAGMTNPAVAKALYDTLPQQVIKPNSTQLAQFKEKTAQALKDPAKKQTVSSYTGSGYQSMNPALRNPASSNHAEMKAKAKALYEASYELPPGLVMSRTFDNADFNYWKGKEGTTMTEPGIISTSLRGSNASESPVFSGNDHWMRIVAGPGLKGMDVAQASSVGSGEAEILLPRNTRFMVARVYKATGEANPGDPFFSKVPKGKTVIEVIAYNPEHMD